MAKSLTELAAEIVAAQAWHRALSEEEMAEALKSSLLALKAIQARETGSSPGSLNDPDPTPIIDPRRSILKNKVICLECGKEFKMLTNNHLKEHGLTTKEYRQKYGFKVSQPLLAKSRGEVRRKKAMERGLGEKMRMARERKG